jgi:hypothetical protein
VPEAQTKEKKAAKPEPHSIEVTVTAAAKKAIAGFEAEGGNITAVAAQRFVEKAAGGRLSALLDRSTELPFSTVANAGKGRLAVRGDAGIFFEVTGTAAKPAIKVFSVVRMVTSTPHGSPQLSKGPSQEAVEDAEWDGGED